MANPESQPKNNRLPLAVTGGIGSGKSTVLGYLSELGIKVWSADEAVARALADLAPAITAATGVSADDQVALREAVLEDHSVRRALNGLVHPVVYRDMRASNASAFELPLLIEACLQGEFEHVWAVRCPVEIRLERIARRGVTPDQAKGLVAIQLPDAVTSAFADAVIRTDCDRTAVQREVAALADMAGLAELP